MKKRIASIIIIGCLLTTSMVTVNAKTCRPYIYVDDDADEDWYDETHVKTINEGIEVAEDGDTIFVFNGIYKEWIRVNKSVKVIGEDKESTIIYKNTFSVFDVEGLTLSGFTIKGGMGIGMGGCYNCTISGNIVTNTRGIGLSNSSYNTITDNIILDTDGEGIDLYYGSCNNTISGNYINNCSGDGINFVYDSNYNTVTGNTVTNNRGEGIRISHHSNYNTITGNTVTNNRYVGIEVIYSDAIHSNNVITENTITHNNYAGIDVAYSDNNIISNNTITHNGKQGIIVVFSDNNVFTDNTIADNGKNGITGNNYDGIYLSISNNNVFTDNTIADNGKNGITVSANCNTFSGNTIANNSRFGISFTGPKNEENIYPSYLNTFSSNTIRDNTRFGVYVNKLCLGNFFYYNNFIDNGQNAWDKGTINLWYNPIKKEGNYWDDWEDNLGYLMGIYIIPPRLLHNNDLFPSTEPFDIENLEVSYVMTEEMTSEESEYLAQLEETINSQILSGELNINDLMNSYTYIVSTPSSTPTSN